MKVVEETEVDSPQTNLFFGLHVQTCLKQAWYHRKELLMAVDTGAGVSIISSETYEKYFFFMPFTPCSTQLHPYTGSTIGVRGQFHADVLHEDQHVALPLIVVQETGPPLLGRNWLHTIRLNWNCILKVEAPHSDFPDSIDQKLQATIQRHPNVFKPGLCTMRKITAKLELKEDARRKFC